MLPSPSNDDILYPMHLGTWPLWKIWGVRIETFFRIHLPSTCIERHSACHALEPHFFVADSNELEWSAERRNPFVTSSPEESQNQADFSNLRATGSMHPILSEGITPVIASEGVLRGLTIGKHAKEFRGSHSQAVGGKYLR
jgi:hypothetical protein